MANGLYSEEKTQENGVLQGEIYSVSLFLVAINEIITQINTPVRTSLFADDFVIFCSGKNLKIMQHQIQEAIENLIEWTKQDFSFPLVKQKPYTSIENNTIILTHDYI